MRRVYDIVVFDRPSQRMELIHVSVRLLHFFIVTDTLQEDSAVGSIYCAVLADAVTV